MTLIAFIRIAQFAFLRAQFIKFHSCVNTFLLLRGAFFSGDCRGQKRPMQLGHAFRNSLFMNDLHDILATKRTLSKLELVQLERLG